MVGIVKLRHYLNYDLRNVGGGHIGYSILKKYQGQGIATKALALAIKIARNMGEQDVLVTVHEDNIGSRRVIEKNGVVVEKIVDDDQFPGKKVFYWIRLQVLPILGPNDVKSPLDKWVISRVHELCCHVSKYMDE
jgi:predicted acetyltransferase